MKKVTILLLFLFISFAKAQAQAVVSQEQFQKLIDYLKEENWPEAARLSDLYLKNIPENRIDDDAAAIVRYMYITTQAGLMYQQKLTKDEAFKNTRRFAGHTIILPWRNISLKQGLNYIQAVNNKPDTLMISGTNVAGTQLFSFEYIVPAKKM